MSLPLPAWRPDDRHFWEREGQAIARRNLLLSIPALMLAFAVWSLWSVVVVYLPRIGFTFSTGQLFLLAALPALCGAVLRVVYALAVPLVGGRRWTAISTLLLLLPAAGLGMAVQDPQTDFPTFVVLALLCGLGGGNFASSMANISGFFPGAQQGFALGLNGGLGNLGVSVAQFVVPFVVVTNLFGAPAGAPQQWVGSGAAHAVWLQNAGFVWIPLILAAALAAALGMDDLPGARTPLADQAAVLRCRATWHMCWLHLGTFGSFIGFAAALPLLLDAQFVHGDGLHYAWLGPLVAALARPVGGWLADEMGVARVTMWSFVFMALAVAGVIWCLPAHGDEGSYHGALAMFLALFAASGAGNGATLALIPVATPRHGPGAAGAAIGLAAAFGACGGFFIPQGCGMSIALTGSPVAALVVFIAFYLSCIAIVWRYRARREP